MKTTRMSMKEILDQLDELETDHIIGLEISGSSDGPNVRRAVFKRMGRYYLFDARCEWRFSQKASRSRKQLLDEHSQQCWRIEKAID